MHAPFTLLPTTAIDDTVNRRLLKVQHTPVPKRRPKDLPDRCAQIRTCKHSARPLLPLAVPVQRDRHSAQPRADQSAERGPSCGIEGRRQPGQSAPRRRVHAMCVEERGGREQGDVQGQERRVRDMCRQRGAVQDKQRKEERSKQRGKAQGEQSGLFVLVSAGELVLSDQTRITTTRRNKK